MRYTIDGDSRVRVVGVRLRDLVREYCEHRRQRSGTQEGTLVRYRTLERFIAHELGERKIGEYDAVELERVLLSIKTLSGKRASWNYRSMRLRAAKALWRFALLREYIDRDATATIEVERQDPQRLPIELPLEIVQKLVRQAESERPWLGDALRLLALTCLRPIELCRLTWKSVELAEGRLVLDGTVRKKNPRPALYPLCPEALTVFRAWHARTLEVVGPERLWRSPCLWYRVELTGIPARMTVSQLTHLFANLVRRMGVRCRRGEVPTLYSLRHFYQQLFEGKTTQDVRMYLMGHSHPSVGPKHYMSTMEEEQRKVTALFPRIT